MRKAPSRLQLKHKNKSFKQVKTPLLRVSPSFLALAFVSGILSVFIGSLLAVTLFKIYVPLESLKVVTKVETVYTGYQPKNEIEELICQEKYKWDCHIMSAIAMAESGQNCLADNTGTNRNGTVDRGIFQINSIHKFDTSMLFDCEYNIEAGYKIWLSQGYKAWSAFNNHSFAKYL